MLKKLEQAKANNETLKVSYTTVLFTGSSGVGKTTLLNKLNKQLNKHHHSTGVVESKHTICVKTTAVTKSTEGLQWIDLDYDLMISHLNKHLHNLKFPSLSSSAATSPPEESVPDDLDEKINNSQSTPSLHLSPTSSLTGNIPSTTRNEGAVETNTVVHVDISKADEVAVDIAKADSSNAPSLGEVWEIINFLDTGGQPEFVNILPAVSSSIALTFIVFNLSESLGSLVHVKHNVRGKPSFEPYYLDCTNLEFIKSLIISSENFNKNITPSLKSIQREHGENDSKICYVGTHALNVNAEEIQEIDSQLSSIAYELQLRQRSFWSSPKEPLKRLFPVDMFPVDKESFEDIIEDIRDNVQKQVQKRDYYEVPITWFIFLLKLQKLCNVKNIGYISYQEAVDVWMDENVNKNELGKKSDQGSYKDQHENVSRENSDVHNILLFFHFMGMLFYYHKVKGMCDFVFVDRQWLFEKLTELVEIKFTKSYRKQYISAEDVDKFTMEGRLSINIIKNLKIDLQGIQPLHFINLLDHLNIVALFDSTQKDYFMPCVLPSFPLSPTKSAEKLNELDKFYGNIQHVPLLVGFKNGPMPHGFFCRLIVELFRHLPEGWCLPLLSTSRMQHVYNNLITFPTTSGHAVSLFYKIGYLEIQVRHEESQPTIIHYNVQCKLHKALRVVSDHLQLNKKQLCFGFYCECNRIQHFAKLQELTSPTEYIYCAYDVTKLTENHRVWLQVYVV